MAHNYYRQQQQPPAQQPQQQQPQQPGYPQYYQPQNIYQQLGQQQPSGIPGSHPTQYGGQRLQIQAAPVPAQTVPTQAVQLYQPPQPQPAQYSYNSYYPYQQQQQQQRPAQPYSQWTQPQQQPQLQPQLQPQQPPPQPQPQPQPTPQPRNSFIQPAAILPPPAPIPQPTQSTPTRRPLPQPGSTRPLPTPAKSSSVGTLPLTQRTASPIRLVTRSPSPTKPPQPPRTPTPVSRPAPVRTPSPVKPTNPVKPTSPVKLTNSLPTDSQTPKRGRISPPRFSTVSLADASASVHTPSSSPPSSASSLTPDSVSGGNTATKDATNSALATSSRGSSGSTATTTTNTTTTPAPTKFVPIWKRTLPDVLPPVYASPKDVPFPPPLAQSASQATPTHAPSQATPPQQASQSTVQPQATSNRASTQTQPRTTPKQYSANAFPKRDKPKTGPAQDVARDRAYSEPQARVQTQGQVQSKVQSYGQLGNQPQPRAQTQPQVNYQQRPGTNAQPDEDEEEEDDDDEEEDDDDDDDDDDDETESQSQASTTQIPPSPQYGIRDLPQRGASSTGGVGPLPQPPPMVRGNGNGSWTSTSGNAMENGNTNPGSRPGSSITMRFAAGSGSGSGVDAGRGTMYGDGGWERKQERDRDASQRQGQGHGQGGWPADLPKLPRTPGGSGFSDPRGSGGRGEERGRRGFSLDDEPPEPVARIRTPEPPSGGTGSDFGRGGDGYNVKYNEDERRYSYAGERSGGGGGGRRELPTPTATPANTNTREMARREVARLRGESEIYNDAPSGSKDQDGDWEEEWEWVQVPLRRAQSQRMQSATKRVHPHAQDRDMQQYAQQEETFPRVRSAQRNLVQATRVSDQAQAPAHAPSPPYTHARSQSYPNNAYPAYSPQASPQPAAGARTPHPPPPQHPRSPRRVQMPLQAELDPSFEPLPPPRHPQRSHALAQAQRAERIAARQQRMGVGMGQEQGQGYEQQRGLEQGASGVHIESPAPVGGRDKMPDIPRIEMGGYGAGAGGEFGSPGRANQRGVGAAQAQGRQYANPGVRSFEPPQSQPQPQVRGGPSYGRGDYEFSHGRQQEDEEVDEEEAYGGLAYLDDEDDKKEAEGESILPYDTPGARQFESPRQQQQQPVDTIPKWKRISAPLPREREREEVATGYGPKRASMFGSPQTSFGPARALAFEPPRTSAPAINVQEYDLPRIRLQESEPAPVPRVHVHEVGTRMQMQAQAQGVGRGGGGGGGSVPMINVESPMISVQDVDVPRIQVGQVGGGGGGPKINVYEVPGISLAGPGGVPGINVSEAGDLDRQQQRHPQSQPQPQQARRRGGLICGGCDGAIVGRIVNAMGLRWHPACFRCTICNELLEHVSSYEWEGRPYCHLDYHENFAPRCYTCKTAIIEERFISLDDPGLGKRTYHEQHFFCAECGDPFLAPSSLGPSSRTGELNVSGDGEFESDDVGFTVYRGHPYCEACHVRLRLPKCKRCKKSIRDGDQAVEALGGKWCWACFVCASCEKPFDDPSFFQRGDQPYCEQCFSIMLRNEV